MMVTGNFGIIINKKSQLVFMHMSRFTDLQ